MKKGGRRFAYTAGMTKALSPAARNSLAPPIPNPLRMSSQVKMRAGFAKQTLIRGLHA